MLDRVPVPTDNIYKFYALFGLVLLIFSFWAIIKVSSDTNELVFTTYPKMQELKVLVEQENIKKNDAPNVELQEDIKKSEITEKKKIELIKNKAALEVLERQQKIALDDQKSAVKLCTGLGTFAFLLCFFGFYRWHVVYQPNDLALAKANVSFLEQQTQKLKTETDRLQLELQQKQEELAQPKVKQESVGKAILDCFLKSCN